MIRILIEIPDDSPALVPGKAIGPPADMKELVRRLSMEHLPLDHLIVGVDTASGATSGYLFPREDGGDERLQKFIDRVNFVDWEDDDD